MNISTNFWMKPIPDRRFDWSAIDSDTYDGAPDSHTRNQIGYGSTELEAIQDLHDQLHDEIVGDEELEDYEVKRYLTQLDAQFGLHLMGLEAK